MAQNITSVSGRNRLKHRREPYWARLSKGRYLGFRPATKGDGTWIARLADEETGKQRYQSLGTLDGVPPSDRYDAAAKEAAAWFVHVDGGGGSKEVVTVRQACEAYVQYLRDEPGKGDASADDAAGRFRRYVYSDAKLSDCTLVALKEARLLSWRNRLVETEARLDRTKDNKNPETHRRALSTVNRDMASFRAALNLAHERKHVASDAAWLTALKPFKKVDGRRSLYLDRSQRSELIAAADSQALADLVRGISTLPLRVGAVAALTVDSFRPATGELFVGVDKAGERRSVVLPDSAAEFLTRLAADRKPTDWLFCRPDGGQWTRKEWGTQLKAVVRAVGLPESTVAYTLRHSGITDLVSHGLDLMTIARLSGTSVEMIERQYFHLLEGRSKAALEVLAL